MINFILVPVGIVIFFVVLTYVFKFVDSTMTEEEKNDKTMVETVRPDGKRVLVPKSEHIHNMRVYLVLLVIIVVVLALNNLCTFIISFWN